MKKNREVYELIGFNIKAIRLDAGLTQLQLAKKCSVDRAKISNMEHGKEDFMFSTLLAIANGLDVEVEHLFVAGKK